MPPVLPLAVSPAERVALALAVASLVPVVLLAGAVLLGLERLTGGR